MKQRRALTTVVGGVFFLIVIITAASYLTYSMNLFESFSQNVFAADQERENRKKESFDISKLTIENNKINLDIHNSGDIPVSLTRLWVENVTGVDEVYRFDLNSTVTTGSTAENILQNISFTALQTESYKMKLVTDRGTTKEFSVNASTEPLHLQLFALPEAVPTNFKSTILLSVTNNSTQNTIYTNIQPLLNVTSLGAVAQFEGPTPEPHPVLEKGETAIFEWSYRISGDDEDKIRFDASILNGVPGNIVSKEVEVQIILFAEESGSSLVSKFLTSDSSPDNILIFHKENFDSLGERQMFSASPEDNLGEIIDFNSTSAIFYSNSDANVTVNIPDGHWDAILRYVSSPMPESLMHTGSNSETMSYHFETDLDSPLDTTTNTVMNLGAGLNRPTWNSAGHQGAGAYEFSGNQFSSITANDNNDLDTSPATTAGWFHAYSSGPASDQIIYYGETSNGNDYLKIFLDSNGYFVYELDAGSSGQEAICTSTVDYKDDSWHHFVGIMPGENDCQLYIDGSLEATDNNGGSGSLILNGDIYIGAQDNSATNGFNGMLDDIIHWDDYALDESGENEVTDLFNTNYGIDAHLLDFEIKIVDEFGNDLGNSNKTISQTFNIPIKYSSDFGEYATPINDIWGQVNLTSNTAEERVIDLGERLMINMTYAPKNLGNLNMKMVIDDTDVLSGLGSSFLQIPMPDVGLPGYGAYDNSDRGTISIFNPGPTDNWIKYQSRVIFEDELTGAPYAAFIDTADNSTITPTQDSPPILADTTATFEFERPRSQPGNISSELIPEGRYRMFVFLDGYDSAGNIFLQTTSIGIVRVT
jgi:hypothetical protein